jgi:hypothetical protein
VSGLGVKLIGMIYFIKSLPYYRFFVMFLVMITILGYGVSIKQKSCFEPTGYAKMMAVLFYKSTLISAFNG